MTKIKEKDKIWLEKHFGKRISFQRLERKLYSHDISAVPGMVKPLIGDTTPDFIVQPETEDELVMLIKWAQEKDIAITPRGKASSGYGGVLPVKKGMVIDFHRLDRIVKIEKANSSVTVEAGIIWEKLDSELKKHQLTLRLYPTSYPASTVGGWLAQGGAGIGSYEAGWFKDNVISARVILADGTIKEFSGDELDLISDAEGITGIISQVTVRIQPLEKLAVMAIGCAEAHGLQKLIQAIVDEKLPIWSMIFINPRMAELKNRAPILQHNGHSSEQRVLLPASYIMTLAFRKKIRN